MRVRFWGVRGSIPVPGKNTVKTGGNTSCVEVRTSDGQVIILDAGTGIWPLGLALAQEFPERVTGTIFFSHTHWDHIQGFPFFTPALRRPNKFIIFGEKRVDQRLEQILAGQMMDAYLPFDLEDMQADLLIKEVRSGEAVVVGEYTMVRARKLDHPGGVFGYRLTSADKVLVYATDVDHGTTALDPRLVELARRADLLIHEAFFTPPEKELHPDWGHSTWEEAAQVARLAEVKRLALFHFNPLHTDDDLEEIERQARQIFGPTILAREGLEIELT